MRWKNKNGMHSESKKALQMTSGKNISPGSCNDCYPFFKALLRDSYPFFKGFFGSQGTSPSSSKCRHEPLQTQAPEGQFPRALTGTSSVSEARLYLKVNRLAVYMVFLLKRL